MTSQTLTDYRCAMLADIRNNVEPQFLDVHNLIDGAASSVSTVSSREHSTDVEEGTADDVRIELERQTVQYKSSPESRRTAILPASDVTTDFDELRFEAAAARQLRFVEPESQRFEYSLRDLREPGQELLISSPYNHPQHLLDLTTLDTQNRLLALALAALKPIRPDYATAGYLESFNWPEVLRILRLFARNEGYEWREQKFYTVIFRSKLQVDIDGDRLGELDQHSHREATESGGLLKYWFGKAGEVGRKNLATCIWRSREDAVRGGGGPWHAQAMRAKVEMYERIGFKRYFLVVGDGALDVRMEEL
ncbi:hypothetical protein E2P81_ATG01900 [Venturia nashicola]|uniref:Uncharacterized protein n=1 Tax=Venturia nashicola TaxID=86259 RepID=A0A4Z1P542_9PEZI|nr:hypothetical protein E6O75_ATG01942 [Venturia nashicola]TLD35597.1 hypothetical protein E2P81_ATG01900 [Venturia nashicola]